jgi:hypothetical protein
MHGEGRTVAVSPRHSVRLAPEIFLAIEHPPRHDFVVRTVARREVNGMPLMTADIVVASAEVRARHPATATYPLHFRKTYFPARLNADPEAEFGNHLLASRLTTIPAPLGHDARTFRSCLIPGQTYAQVSPFGADPPESNIVLAQKQPLATLAGLWRLAEEALAQFNQLHAGGLTHGDAQLHNCIVCPRPLEAVLVDFEAAVQRKNVDEPTWNLRCEEDLAPLLREAIYLQCALGEQQSPLGSLARDRLERLFERHDAFRQAIETQAGV